jgi:transcriptional regulator with XRE-family HTH domain
MPNDRNSVNIAFMDEDIKNHPGTRLNMAVAAEIRAERAAQGLTLEELSNASEIPVRTLIRLTKGERNINVNQLAKIGNALDVDPTELVRRALIRANMQ